MYCPKCGLDNKDGARFCKTCGSPLPLSSPRSGPDTQPGMNYANMQTPVAEMPAAYGLQPEKKAIKPATVAILAIIIAAVLIFVFVVTPALKPKNPIAALYDGFKGIMTSEGFDSTYVASSVRGSTEYYISYKLGEDIESTIFDMSSLRVFSYEEYNFSDWARVMMYDGEIAMGSDYSRGAEEDDYDYIKKEMIDPDNFYREDYSGYDAFDDLEEELEYELGISVPLNRLISDNHIDWDRIWKLVDDSLSEAVNDYMLDAIGLDSLPKTASIRALFEDFIYDYCSKKDVINKIAKDLKKSGNSYTFSFDTKAFLEALEDYLSELKDDEKALDKMGLKRTEVRAFESLVNLVFPYYENFSDRDSVTEFSIKKGNLERLVWTGEVDGETVTIELNIKNVNKPSVGNKEFVRFFSEIDEY